MSCGSGRETLGGRQPEPVWTNIGGDGAAVGAALPVNGLLRKEFRLSCFFYFKSSAREMHTD